MGVTETSNSPASIGKYEIETTLGSGSMGVVYRARDPEIGRVVAIKTLRNIFLGDDSNSEAMQRFRQESRSAGKLRHPNIITVFEAGRTEHGSPYIVMDYIDGLSFEELIKQRAPVDPCEALHYLGQVASAIDYAHEQGVIHRDIKPSNVLLDKNFHPYLLDFGVAKLADTSLTPAGMVVGTPSYMAPEQIRGETLDGGTDRFAFAVVAFELLTGVRPFPGTDFTTVVSNIIHNAPLTFVDCGVGYFPPSLEPVMQRGLSKVRIDRYPTCAEFVNAMGKALSVPVGSLGVSGFFDGMKWPRGDDGGAAVRTQMSTPIPVTTPPPAPPVPPVEAKAPVAPPAKETVAPKTASVAVTAGGKDSAATIERPKDPRPGMSFTKLLGVVVAMSLVGAGSAALLSSQGGLEVTDEVESIASLRSDDSTDVIPEATPRVTESVSETKPVQTNTVQTTKALSTSSDEVVQRAAVVDTKVSDAPSDTRNEGILGTTDDVGSRTLAVLTDPKSDQKALIDAIGSSGTSAEFDRFLPALLALSKHPEYPVRVAVLRSFVGGDKLRNKEVLRTLVGALDDPEYIVRGFAVKTIASFENGAALKLLEKRLEVETNDIVKQVLIGSIAKLKGSAR
ncbi:MAG: protein kinase [Deltaproteobacteria bacterium]|nr:protein kinase [Deltaproteobacteria bacterium]